MKHKVSLKQSNIGMTLIELLVAVAIFVAAIVPMLYAFVYSTGFNFKAQQSMQATGIAQAIIEKTKAANTNYGDIIASIQDKSILEAGNDFTVGSVSTISGGFKLSNVRATHVAGEAVDGGNSSRRYYDVEILISPEAGGIIDHSIIQSMSSNTANFVGASFTQYLRSEDAAARDAAIAKIKETVIDNATEVRDTNGNLKPDTLISVFTQADIKPNDIVLDRYITITAKDDTVDCKVEYYYNGYDRNGDGRRDTTEFSIIHSYTPVNLILKGDPGYHMGGTPIYTADFSGYANHNADGSVSFFVKSDPGDPRPSAVYFYYYPGYKFVEATDCSFIDYFELKNEMTDSPVDDKGYPTNRLDFYLFKQLDDSNTHVDDCESVYKPIVNMTAAPFDTYLYHNFYYPVTNNSIVDVYSNPTFSVGTNWHEEMNQKDSLYLYGATSFLDKLRNPSTNESVILSDRATIPYRHMPSDHAIPMFNSRYTITVRVYPAGSDQVINQAEMKGEFLNW